MRPWSEARCAVVRRRADRFRLVALCAAALCAVAAAASPATGPPKAGPPAVRPLVIGGMALQLRNGRLVVGSVLPGSPAALTGALPGDVILVMNDVTLVDLDPLTPEAALDRAFRGGREEIRMIVGRGAGTLGIVLPLREAAGTDDSSADVEALAVGAAAPAFSGKDIRGDDVSLSLFRGRPVLIAFWASWCPPCREAVIPLLRLAGQYGDRLAMIGVSLDTDPKNFEAFVYNYHLPGRQILDGGWSGPIARRYGIGSTGIPYSVLIDAAGRVVSLGPTIHEHEAPIAQLLPAGSR
jgi:thiol-disulfide isomerase/thioredoxin